MTTLLFFAMLLGVAYSHRELIVEQRTAANQVRSTQAFEAAEAGLEWVIARINDNRRIGDDCEPLGGGAASLRDRWLRFEPASRRHLPITWHDGAGEVPTEAACVRGADGWICHCPAGAFALAPPAAAAAAAFRVHVMPGDRPGAVRVVSSGCVGVANACRGAADELGATARLEVALGLLPALRSLPVAALTARGDIASGAGFAAKNADPSSGVALHAGARIDAPHVELAGPAGSALATTAIAGDAAVAAQPPERLFAALFGAEPARWSTQPNVVEVECALDCAGALSRALSGGGENAILHVSGDASLVGPVTLGSPRAPVLIVASGTLALSGAVSVQGVVYAGALAWTGSGGAIHGAAISESDYTGSGSPSFVYDPLVLERLRGAGTFARVSGSWRDF
ncbi:pilus assembly PilX N-terminal domain-containing protein [Schlegelella sp. ID0723]|uniref:Pilus assembly PilX N-terminal domain-containing protein n=2 Tax=Piscinibacter koreensis TaxID=2742824 RepID=A0A7Y6NQ46_9BURK|nr:pilus assembly PilX N-terminal domain-containing protein [Schlegelella koreensis]